MAVMLFGGELGPGATGCARDGTVMKKRRDRGIKREMFSNEAIVCIGL